MSSDVSPVASDMEGLQQYRQLSILAVISLFLGFLSPVALAHPAAWSIAAAAIAVALVAIWRIGKNSETIMGLNVARFGLVLGVFFLACAGSRYFGERAILYREARAFSEEWLEAVFSGDLDKAHQGAIPFRQRQPEGTLLDEYYANNETAQIDRDNFFASGTYMRITQLKPGTTFKFHRDHVLIYDKGDWYINQRFLLQEPGTDLPYPLQTEVFRYVDEDGVHLRMVGVADARAVDGA